MRRLPVRSCLSEMDFGLGFYLSFLYDFLNDFVKDLFVLSFRVWSC